MNSVLSDLVWDDLISIPTTNLYQHSEAYHPWVCCYHPVYTIHSFVTRLHKTCDTLVLVLVISSWQMCGVYYEQKRTQHWSLRNIASDNVHRSYSSFAHWQSAYGQKGREWIQFMTVTQADRNRAIATGKISMLSWSTVSNATVRSKKFASILSMTW